ncbi:Reverse transcriptase (RNA-dependent DNA polymerase) [Popillia japonica]|uniref:Reverse transcriptase (RNA-dependent DNA polymerase) n=1 Tax=Popillia japonica TaxID=7064 RepID=A0AAW1KMX0_POPJA
MRKNIDGAIDWHVFGGENYHRPVLQNDVKNTKGYRLIDPLTKKLVRSRDVVFLENEFYNREQHSGRSLQEFSPNLLENSEKVNEDHQNDEENQNDENTEENLSNEESDCDENLEKNRTDDDDEYYEFNVPLDTNQEIRRSSRQPKPKQMNDYISFLAEKYLSEPQTVQEALESPDNEKWIRARKAEHDSLLENNTWELVDLPEAETFSPVVRYSSIRFLCALAVKYDLAMHHMDVTTAYLQGELHDEIYIYQPEYLRNKEDSRVYRLKKAMYGLKQSGRSWNKKLNIILKEMGLLQSKADQCIFYKMNGTRRLIIAVYVEQRLQQKLKIKDLGVATEILGIRIARDFKKGTLKLDQSSYIEKILNKFNMNGCKPVTTPADPNAKLDGNKQPKEDVETEEIKNVPYQEAIENLLFLCQGMRPDITYATCMLSRYSKNPERRHWSAVKRIFRYLRGTTNMKLEFSKDKEQFLEAYSDADWANELDDRRSITGNVIKFQHCAISWSS